MYRHRRSQAHLSPHGGNNGGLAGLADLRYCCVNPRSHVFTDILCSHFAWLIDAGRRKHKVQSNLQGRN